jgi:hypothetical protein
MNKDKKNMYEEILFMPSVSITTPLMKGNNAAPLLANLIKKPNKNIVVVFRHKPIDHPQ